MSLVNWDAKDVLFGMPVTEIARRAYVDVSTARRWKSGASVPSQAHLALLSGDLGAFDSTWAGWIIRKGELVSPESLCHTPGDVRAIPFELAARRALEGRIRELEAGTQEPALIEQPTPDEWEVAIAV